jgi:hypothetical protein
MRKGKLGRAVTAATYLAVSATAVVAQVPTPRSIIGWEPGADYKLADYDQIQEYYQALAASSDRVVLYEIGRSVQDRPILLVAISSEQNIARIDEYRMIAQRLARARDLTLEEATELARHGKAILWVNVGIDPEEVATAQHTMPLAYHLVSSEDDEIRRIRDSVIVLLVPVMHPDGQVRAVEWYRRNLGTPFESVGRPQVYKRHPYIGSDTNRDMLFLNMPESRAIAREILYVWYPQIIHDHHQTGPFPGRIWVPPFTDPVNPVIHPLVIRGTNLVGSHLAKRFAEEGMPGVSSYLQYPLWWNGGMRALAHFHNMVGYVTETAGYNHTATPHYYDPNELPDYFRVRTGHTVPTRSPSIFYPDPWLGGWWRIGDAVRYMVMASIASADIAARLREDWLLNIYRMGRAHIDAGEIGKPFAYVIPPDQWDRGAALEMLKVLQRGGIEVHRAVAPFSADGVDYTAGTYVVRASQAFRAHLLDVMEPQVYPDRRLYPGGPPDPPYDLSGWTVPIQMGVDVSRIDAPFEAQLEVVQEPVANPGRVATGADFGYLLEPGDTWTTLAVNRLLAAGERVSRAERPFRAEGREYAAGSVVVAHSGSSTTDQVKLLAQERGLEFLALAQKPDVPLQQLRLPRIAIYKSMVKHNDEGWTRWLLQRYGFAFDVLLNSDVQEGVLHSRYDVIVLPNHTPDAILNGHAPGTMVPEFTGGVGPRGVLAIEEFVRQGGTLLALAHASDFAIRQLGLPIRNSVEHLPETEFFVPASLLRINVDQSHPLAFGMPREAAAFYSNTRGHRSMAYEIIPVAREGDQVAPEPPVEVVARYSSNELLLSGWELNADRYLGGKPSIVRVAVGEGAVVLYGFPPQKRAQPAGTFKLLFNALHHAGAIMD